MASDGLWLVASLIRFVRFGRDCEAPVPATGRLLHTYLATSRTLGARWVHPTLHDQCPLRLQTSSTIMCPWDTPACPARVAESAVAAIRVAETALRREGLDLTHAMDRGYVPRGLQKQLDKYSHIGGGGVIGSSDVSLGAERNQRAEPQPADSSRFVTMAEPQPADSSRRAHDGHADAGGRPARRTERAAKDKSKKEIRRAG
jgi:hypothetical protein